MVKRTRGRPMKRWRDELDTNWRAAARNGRSQNRAKLKHHVQPSSNMWIDKRLIMMTKITVVERTFSNDSKQLMFNKNNVKTTRIKET